MAANRCGVGLLEALVAEQGARAVTVTMEQLQEAAAGRVRREIARLPDGEHVFEDRLDDGTPVFVLPLWTEGGRYLRIDRCSPSADSRAGPCGVSAETPNGRALRVTECGRAQHRDRG